MNEKIETILNEMDEPTRLSVRRYLEDKQISGNPILEQYFILVHEVSMIAASKHKELEELKLKHEELLSGFHASYQVEFQKFLDEMTVFTAQQVKDMKTQTEIMNNNLMNLPTVIVGKVQELIVHEERQAAGRLKELCEVERNQILSNIRKELRAQLAPNVEKVFRSSIDKFKLLVIGRDIGVVLIAFGIFQGIKAIFF